MARIDHYEFGRIVIDGREETNDLIIPSDRVVRDWWRQEGHALVVDDLGEVLDELPTHLVVGQGPGVLSLCLVGEVGPGGVELVWSRHELPGSCGSHSLMTTVEARACRPIIPDPAGPDRPGPR